MFRFLIRLDDACPTMYKDNWDRIEEILDRYSIKPIVGVIPDCEDRSVGFNNQVDEFFWDKVKAWENKGWEIALHGLHHTYHDMPKGIKSFQLNIEPFTEFVGIDLERQEMMIQSGIDILKEHGICPTCFFAPAHTFDINTVKACKKTNEIEYISDGYALRPYKKVGMIFIPAVFDTPHKMPFGLFTFVFHPSRMTEKSFTNLVNFLEQNYQYVTTVESVLGERMHGQGLLGRIIEVLMYAKRVVKNDVR